MNPNWNCSKFTVNTNTRLHHHQLKSSLGRLEMLGFTFIAPELPDPITGFQPDTDLAGELPPCVDSGVLWLPFVVVGGRCSFVAALSDLGT